MIAAQAQWINDDRERDEFAMAHDELAHLIDYLRSPSGRALDHAELEIAINDRGRELLRVLMQAQIDSRGQGAAVGPVQGADAVARGQQRLHQRGLSTLFGQIQLKRLGYGATGVESLHPLDAELNLPDEQYSLGVRRLAAQSAAQVSFDATVEMLAERTGQTIGKRQVEQLVQRAAKDFDAYYAQQRPATDAPSSAILAITVDGKGVVMRPADLREATRKAHQHQADHADSPGYQGGRHHAKRMATVAAVYTVAPYVRTPEQMGRSLAPLHEPAPARPPIENKRVWASVVKTPEEVIEAAFQEALRRDPERDKTWVGLVDGNAKQLAVLKAMGKKHNVKLTIVMDVIHVAEYLWEASLAFYTATSPQRATWVTVRLGNVLRGNAARVAAGMRRSATLRGLSKKERAPVDVAARYLLNHQQYMHYDRYLRAGLPIATGVIEGACRHLICDRMDGVARWSLNGAEAVLAIRALRCSGDFDDYWRYHVRQEYQRNHVDAYLDGNVAPIRGRSPPTLKCVS